MKNKYGIRNRRYGLPKMIGFLCVTSLVGSGIVPAVSSTAYASAWELTDGSQEESSGENGGENSAGYEESAGENTDGGTGGTSDGAAYDGEAYSGEESGESDSGAYSGAESSESGSEETTDSLEDLLTAGSQAEVGETESSLYGSLEDLLENEEIWEASASDVVLTGNYGEDIAAIAESQLGVRESLFITEDGVTATYSRYGQWLGAETEEWSAAFVEFCAFYAGISEEAIPREQSVESLADALNEHFILEESSVPEKGDLIFFTVNSHSEENTLIQEGVWSHVGIVTEVSEDMVYTIEGNCDGMVSSQEYDREDPVIGGYVSMESIQLEAEAEDFTGEAEDSIEARESLSSGVVFNGDLDGDLDEVGEDGTGSEGGTGNTGDDAMNPEDGTSGAGNDTEDDAANTEDGTSSTGEDTGDPEDGTSSGENDTGDDAANTEDGTSSTGEDTENPNDGSSSTEEDTENSNDGSGSTGEDTGNPDDGSGESGEDVENPDDGSGDSGEDEENPDDGSEDTGDDTGDNTGDSSSDDTGEDTDSQTYIGSFIITVKAWKDGEDYNTTDRFYAGIFSDADFTQRITTVKLTLQDTYTLSRTVRVSFGTNANDSKDYYITQTDQNGTPIDVGASFTSTVGASYVFTALEPEDGKVTVTPNNTPEEVVLTNSFIEGAPTSTPEPTTEAEDTSTTDTSTTHTSTTDTSTTGTSTGTSDTTTTDASTASTGTTGTSSVQTGDETPVMWFAFLFVAALAVVGAAVTVLRRIRQK